MPVKNPISVGANSKYGGGSASNKYGPLKPITLDPTHHTDYESLVEFRHTLLKVYGAFPDELQLTMSNWNDRVSEERGGNSSPAKSPPLVVISSNRARYISTGLATVEAQLSDLKLNNFNNIGDLRAFKLGTAAPPIYCPKRLGPDFPRNVYVVVHFKEYAKYVSELAPYSGIHVVGYSFKTVNAPLSSLAGFGASRYAAIEFCKQLRTQAKQKVNGNDVYPWNLAWLLDDNVVGLTARTKSVRKKKNRPAKPSVPGKLQDNFLGVENALTSAGNSICAGLKGLQQAQSIAQTEDWVAEVSAKAELALPDAVSHGVIQQAACWNIALLQERSLNFSPYFVASKEDVSFANYFDANEFVANKELQYKFYNLVVIHKEECSVYDDKIGIGNQSKDVNDLRALYTRRLAFVEGSTPISNIDSPGTKTNLRDFIAQVLKDSVNLDDVQAADIPRIRKAECQAIESILTAAIKGAFNYKQKINPTASQSWMDSAKLETMFATNVLTVNRRDVP